jgi:hypothetical protein
MSEFEVGDRVCLTGWGTAAPVHTHKEKVDRLTKTMVVTTDGRRFNRRTRQSTGRSDYGWIEISKTCQRAKKKETRGK